MSELKVGAIVEIRTASGLAYAQYTHHHPTCGEVVRLLPGRHETRPDDLASLVRSQGGTHFLLPLKQALARDGSPLAIAGWQPVPAWDERFPTFRMAIRDRQGNVAYWWLWDGATVWPQTELTEDQRQLPYRAVSSVEQLIAHLERKEAAEPA